MAYQILYSETSRKQIRKLHPRTRPAVKSGIKKLHENPYSGKLLEKELSGYRSIRMRRFRVIYKIDEKKHKVEIHYVGHRKDIYEIFRESLYKD